MNIIKKSISLIKFLTLLSSLMLLSNQTLAANIALASSPLAASTPTSVLPNLMFILDNSGSMNQDFTPDWVVDYDDDSITGGRLDFINPFQTKNSAFNTQFYNPTIKYTPAVNYDGSSKASQTTFTTVLKDAYNKQETGTTSVVGKANFYSYVPGEYCKKVDLRDCIASSIPTATYPIPAPMRWCNTSAAASTNLPAVPVAGACQAVRISSGTTFNNLRTPRSAATIVFAVSNNSQFSSVKVSGLEIMSATTAATNNTGTMASLVRDNINACTKAIIGNCQSIGYSASSSGSTVTITSNWGDATVPLLPVVTRAGGLMTAVPTVFVARTPGRAIYTDITNPAFPVKTYAEPGQLVKASNRSDCAGTVCTYTEEMTNYANWYAYYRTRMQGMKTSASLAFKPIGTRYRVGFITINSPTGNYLAANDFVDGATNQKDNWYAKLFNAAPGNSTPLREALSTVGRIYAGKLKTTYGDPVQYACQPNFALLTTDGYWNGNGGKTVANVDIGDLDSASPKPIKDTANQSNTLADTAKYYYETDLRQAANPFNNCIGAKGFDVCGDSTDPETLSQHMSTLTLGLGIDGRLQYTSDYKVNKSGDYYELREGGTKDWGNPIANTAEDRIDDLWHAAVNANGTYFSAKNPQQVTESLQKALSEIQSKLGAGTGAAASTLQPVAGNNENIIPSYRTVKWTGNLEGRAIDLTTLETSDTATWCVESVPPDSCAGTIQANAALPGTGNYYCVTKNETAATCSGTGKTLGGTTGTDCFTEVTNACTGKMQNLVTDTGDARTIKINNGSGTLVDFSYSNIPSGLKQYFEATLLATKLSQWDTLTGPADGSSGQRAKAIKQDLVQYLRGSYGLEDRGQPGLDGIFRAREATLGDVTDSQPVYLNKQAFNYSDTGYQAFKTSQDNRPGRVYVGANDGMFHMFDATIGSVAGVDNRGKEIFSFIPTPVIPNLYKLADRDYAVKHTNFVNGDPVIGDVYDDVAGAWKRILVSGLAGGGRGYFALDITDPNNTKLLWEYTAADNANLGYTYGNPVITKMANGGTDKWVVLITSGYNNGSKDSDGSNYTTAGNGKGYLIALNPITKAQVKIFPTGEGLALTPSGLSQIAAYTAQAEKNNLTKYVYAGDLLGNLWRFDIEQPDGTAPLKFATLVGPDNVTPQPITMTPQLGVIKKKRVVFVGTGTYLQESDLVNPSSQPVQTLYAIMDKDIGTPLGNPRPSLISQAISNSGSNRVISSPGTVDFSSGLGWLIDLPAGERQNVDALLVNGVIFVPTLLPKVTDCSPGGIGYFNFFNYKSGGSVIAGGIVSDIVAAPIVGINVIYDQDGDPRVGITEANKPGTVFTPHSDVGQKGQPKTNMFEKNDNNTYGKRKLWRELTR